MLTIIIMTITLILFPSFFTKVLMISISFWFVSSFVNNSVDIAT